MPTLQEYEQSYGADDRDEVLRNIRQYGTDDRTKWNPQSSSGGSEAPQASAGFLAPNTQSGAAATTMNNAQPAADATSQWNNAGAAPKTIAGVNGAPSTQPFDRTSFRDSWMATGSDKAAQDRLLQQAGLTLDPAGRATLPTGEIIDLRIGAKAGGTQASWTNAGGTQNGVPVTGMGGSGPSAGGVPQTGGGFQAGGAGGSVPGGAMGDFMRTLLERSNQSLNINRNDPAVRGQADAYAANEERSKRNSLADLAERAGPNANLRGEERLGNERVGQRTGAFEAELMGRELVARREEIAQALQTRAGMLSQQEQIAAQKELAALDAQLRSRGLDLQGRQIDQDWQKAMLNNTQFMNRLGLDAEDQASKWDAIRSGLM